MAIYTLSDLIRESNRVSFSRDLQLVANVFQVYDKSSQRIFTHYNDLQFLVDFQNNLISRGWVPDEDFYFEILPTTVRLNLTSVDTMVEYASFHDLYFFSKVQPPPPLGANYYMNFTDDTPQGSLSHGIYIEGVLYEMNHIGSDTNKLSGITLGLNYTLVNGYKAQRFNTGAPYYYVLRFSSSGGDILTGLTNLTFAVSFKSGEAVGTKNKFIFNHDSTNRDVWLCLFLDAYTGFLHAIMASTLTNRCNAITTTRKDDDVWHIAIVTYDQTNKTATLYMEDGTKVSSSNGLYQSGSLTTDRANCPQIGALQYPPTKWLSYFGDTTPTPTVIPAIGDILFKDGILTTDQLNSIGFWMATRLGITWTDII